MMLLTIDIVNVIATAQVPTNIDLESLSKELVGSQYHPAVFAGLVYRRLGKPTIIFFANGKVSSHGAKSEFEAKSAIIEVAEELIKSGHIYGKPKVDEIKIQNVVAKTSFNHKIYLEALYTELPFAIYEPEQFPALMYKPFKDSLVCLIFSTGRMIIVGAKSQIELEKAFQNVSSHLSKL